MLTTSYPRFKGDYSGIFIHNLCVNLADMGVRLKVIAPRCASQEFYESRHEVTRFPYLPLRRLETISETSMRGAPIKNLIQLPAYLTSAAIHAATADVELIHTHSAIPLGFTSSLSCPRKSKVITCHGSDCTMSIKDPLLATFTRTALKKSDRIVTVSNYIKNLAIRLGASPEKTETVYMGVDINRFHPPKNRRLLQRKYGFDGDTVIVGTLGRIVPEKRFEELIHVAKLLNGKIDVRFIIGGDGSHLNSLRKLVAKNGLKNITFLGRIQNPQKFHRLCDLFVLTSPIEGLSTVLQEAMATGCTPVAAEAGGTPELIKQGVNGLLYKPGDILALAKCIMEAIDTPELADSARSTINRSFDMSRNARRYLSLYGEVSGGEI